jgi:gamma-glutamyl:cysteine ligase YbdK (ATP-grasp superfamily)
MTRIVCDVSALGPRIANVDALARLQLAARRCGHELELRDASPELRELVAFAGLANALRLEMEREPEEREQRGGVEEERQLDDPSA